MSLKNRYIVALIMAIIIIGRNLYADTRMVPAVRFNGLKHVSRYEIARDAGIRVTKDGIVVDTGELEKALRENSMIQGFSLEMDGAALVVTVREREPAVALAVISGDSAIPALLDSDLTVIAASRTASLSGPVFVVEKEEIRGNSLSRRFHGVYGLIKSSAAFCPDLYRELEEVSLLADGRIELKLKGRPVRCRMKPSAANMKRLDYTIGYMDRTGKFPELVEIDSDSVVVR
jgi:hypothetical protein